jgi:predicted nucleic acid-binding protein
MRIVVSDANVLINLIHVDRLSLLGALEGLEFVIPDQVVNEVTSPEQAPILEAALDHCWLSCVSVKGTKELGLYADLRQVMGKGESACLAIAEQREWLVASDERGRFLRIAKERLGEGRILNTPGLFVLGIRAGLLSVEDADKAKRTLEGLRFKMTFESCREVLGAG